MSYKIQIVISVILIQGFYKFNCSYLYLKPVLPNAKNIKIHSNNLKF